jgi:cell shape-determining protein MreC
MFDSVCDEACDHLKENQRLLATIKHLKSENERLREKIESSDGELQSFYE